MPPKYASTARRVAYSVRSLTPQPLVRIRWLLRLVGHNRFLPLRMWLLRPVHQREIRMSPGGQHQWNFFSEREGSVSIPRKRETYLPLSHLLEANEGWHVSSLRIVSFQFKDLQSSPRISDTHWIRPSPIADESIAHTKLKALRDNFQRSTPSSVGQELPDPIMPGLSGTGPRTTRIQQDLSGTQPELFGACPIRQVLMTWPHLVPTTRTSSR